MKKVIHKADTRGHSQYDWLDSYHTFSFDEYFDSDRINFGALRVLNDDKVAPGQGFQTHPHKNMEVISIPLKGHLQHGDSKKNSRIITVGEIQTMSAGTGIFHSEVNASPVEPVEFLQIWIMPRERNTRPVYQDFSITELERPNELAVIVSPDGSTPASLLQDTWFSIGKVEAGKKLGYHMHQSHAGVYIFLIEGEIVVDGEVLKRRDGFPTDGFSVRWTACYMPQTDGQLKLHIGGDDGYRLFVNDKHITGDWGNHSYSSREVELPVEGGKEYRFRIEFFDNISSAIIRFNAYSLNEAKLRQGLAKVDNVVFCTGFNSNTEGEGFDRPFALLRYQELFIKKIASMHPNVVVVLNAGGGVDFTNWYDAAKAILMAWYPGQEGGQAIAEILTGKISPSGKLPISIERKWEDNPVHGSYYENLKAEIKRVDYSEGVFVGYRGYDRSGKEPFYPFGYGLSYTTFAYSNMAAEKTGEHQVTVSFDIENTGKMDASEVAQVYVHDVQSSVPRPLKELKGYEKVFLKKGEKKRVSVVLDEDAFSFYDMNQHRFVVEKGDFEILVGPASSQLPLKAMVEL